PIGSRWHWTTQGARPSDDDRCRSFERPALTLGRLAALLSALAILVGCGEEQAGEGRAALWTPRDRGADVIKTADVPAGISAMEALRREADVDTRYGGRFVQAINGIEGSV